MMCYLLDPVLAQSASGFVSQLLLSVTANFRLGVPQVNVLSKCDLLEEEKLEQILGWSDDPQNAYTAVINEEASVYRDMNEGVLRLLEELGGYSALVPVSREQLRGIDDVYAVIQQQFHASDDVLKD